MASGDIVSVQLGARQRARARRPDGRRRAGGGRDRRRRARSSTVSRRRSSSSRSGSPTTTAPRPLARSRSSRRAAARGAASGATPAGRDALAGEAEPEALTRRPARRRRSDRRRTRRGWGPRAPRTARPGAGRPRSTSRPALRRSRAGEGRSSSCPEIALTPQTVGRFRGALRRPRRRAPLGAHRGGAPRRARADRRRRGAASSSALAPPCSRPCPTSGSLVVDEEHDSSFKQESDPRYDARTVAAKRGRARGRGRRLRQRDAAARELGAARAARAPVPHRRAAADACVSSTSAARPATRSRRRSWPSSRPSRSAAAGRSCCSTGAACSGAIHCRSCGVSRRCRSCDVTLTLHARRSPPLPPLRLLASSCPRAARSAARSSSPASAPGTQRLEAELAKRVPGARAHPARRGHRVEAGRLTRGAGALRARRPRRCCSGRRWWRRGTTSPASRSRRWSTPTRGSRSPTSAPRSARSSSSRSSPAAAGAMHRAGCSCRPSSRMRRRSVYAARHDVAGFLARELARREELGYPPFGHLVSIVVSGPEPDAPRRALDRAAATRSPVCRGVRLLGPAPLLRLRGRHRAQLVAKTGSPRALASRAAALLSAAAPAMRGDGLTAVVDVDPQSL